MVAVLTPHGMPAARNPEAAPADALRHLGAHDTARVWETLAWWIRSGRRFSAEHVTRALAPELRTRLETVPNALGALFRLAARNHLMFRTGETVPALHAAARGRQLPLWIGVPRGGSEPPARPPTARRVV